MDFNSKTPRGTIVIAGHDFSVPKPFVKDHVCTENEAGSLNQTMAENARNNFSTRVKAAVEAGEDVAALQADLDTYLKTYEFGVRRGGGSSDPVSVETRRMARSIVENALKTKGHVIKDVDKDNLKDLVEKVIAENPQIREQAEKTVAQRATMVEGIVLPDSESTE